MNRLVSRLALRDRHRAEAVNTLSPGEILRHLRDRFGFASVGAARIFEEGEVLSDGRGRGSLQRLRDVPR